MKMCRKTAKLMGAYVCGGLSPDEMRLVRQHIDHCASCKMELESRMRTISFISNEAPSLTDEERTRIMWSVKGAIQAREKKSALRPILWRCVQAGVAAVIIAVVFTAGMRFQADKAPEKVAVKPTPTKHQPKSNPPEVSQDAPLLVAAPPSRDRLPETFRSLQHKRHKPVQQFLTKPETDNSAAETNEIKAPLSESTPQSFEPIIKVPENDDNASIDDPNNMDSQVNELSDR